MADVERWPEWTSSVTRVEKLTVGPLAPGSTARILQPKLPPAVYTVTEMAEGRSFTWVTRHPLVTGTATHVITPLDHGSRVTLTVQFSGVLGNLLARLRGDLTRRYMHLEAAGLKRISENPG